MNKSIAICLLASSAFLAGCSQPAAHIVSDEPPAAKPSKAVDPMLDAMTGKWVADVDVMNTKRVDDIEAKWILDGGYFQLHELSRNKDAAGKPAYEATVLMELDPKTHEYNCLWLDTTGGGGLSPHHIVGVGKRYGDSIAFLFKYSGGDFHNTFVYNRAENTWKWILDGESDGKLEPFARLSLVKMK